MTDRLRLLQLDDAISRKSVMTVALEREMAIKISPPREELHGLVRMYVLYRLEGWTNVLLMIGECYDSAGKENVARHCRELRQKQEQILDDIDRGDFTSVGEELLRRGEQICEDSYGSVSKLEIGEGLIRVSGLL
ncbi:MAG: hypothetical protein AAB512_04930 [Patescibacteria group bacterium]